MLSNGNFEDELPFIPSPVASRNLASNRTEENRMATKSKSTGTTAKAVETEELPRADLANPENTKDLDRYSIYSEFVAEQTGLDIPAEHLRAAVVLYQGFQRSDLNRQFNAERKDKNSAGREERRAAYEEKRAAAAAAKEERAKARAEKEEARKTAQAEKEAAAAAKKAATKEKPAAAPAKAAPAKTASAPAKAAAKTATSSGTKAPAKKGKAANKPF